MPTVQELLKNSGLADDVVAGLPKEAIAAFGNVLSEADTKLSAAAQEAKTAEEARRQAKLDRDEMQQYVERYSSSLNEQGSIKAKYDAVVSYVNSLKAQGFDVELPADLKTVDPGDGKKPVVPGSPAIGGNAVDEGKILGKVGNVLSQWMDANNEHIRLYGTPIPDASTDLAEEAARARKPLGVYAAEKYKFSETRKAKAEETRLKDINAAAQKIADERERERKEREGSNPNVRAGEASRSSHLPKIKSDEFHKSDGNVPKRERERRMLENLHKDVEAIHSAA